ncbi:hypothetical protein BD560DRAFT_427979 [Blakeslea trispora]|nr:hypothetical protein BD560DRAFT_427979 [Blakeslea trispora]
MSNDIGRKEFIGIINQRSKEEEQYFNRVNLSLLEPTRLTNKRHMMCSNLIVPFFHKTDTSALRLYMYSKASNDHSQLGPNSINVRYDNKYSALKPSKLHIYCEDVDDVAVCLATFPFL